MTCEIHGSPIGGERLSRVREWLANQERGAPLLIIASSLDAAHQLLRIVAEQRTAMFGWYCESLASLAGKLAALPLAREGRAPLSGFGAEALCARVLFELRASASLGRFARVCEQPGLPRALAATLLELGMAGVEPDAPDLESDLARLYAHYRVLLERFGLCDRARVFATATRAAETGAAPIGLPTVLWDLRIESSAERDLVRAIAARSSNCLATLPELDARTRAYLIDAFAGRCERVTGRSLPEPGAGALARLQTQLFAPPLAETMQGELGDEVSVLSAPGEARECVEIARRVLAEAERGVRFDQMAVLLRSPELYGTHLGEAMARARVPVHFSRGTLRPDPGSRALLALLACAAERLSARRFAEYLSLGVVPELTEAGAPPAALAPADRFVPTSDDTIALGASAASMQEGSEVVFGNVPAPRHWERLLTDAAVIGGVERWRHRLDGLEQALAQRALEDPDHAEAIERDRSGLRALRAFALPLVEALHALPARADWGTWLDALSALATRALAEPSAVLQGLSELLPMSPIGPVELPEVRSVLERRFGEQRVRPGKSSAGKLLVCAIDEARGMAFEVVFVPGLAEKMFPPRIHEDPLLLDAAREQVSPHLAVAADRIADERCALQIAVGAARARAVVSYPRFATERGRPRVPSFYGLEVLRAAEGRLPGFGELATRATEQTHARMGWPAPRDTHEAIDAAEYDLVVLDRFLHGEKREMEGAAHYLLSSNPHLGRALRFRARRWHKNWHATDGLVEPQDGARAALARHALAARPYSASVLQKYALCPYRFYLSGIIGLSPRDAPEAIEVVDGRTRGVLLHQVLRAFQTRMRDAGSLPVTQETHAAAQRELDQVIDEVSARARDRLAPAIDRVWDDNIIELRADLHEWLAREVGDAWLPLHFELGFGLPAAHPDLDAGSTREAVALECGIALRGAIDSVEQQGAVLRATDYKTGIAPGGYGVIAGGRSLQGVLYALALEKRFPSAQVAGGDAYYCTTRGKFQRLHVALDVAAREAAAHVAKAIGDGIATGFLPAAPDKGACEHCEFLPVCGPYEEQRVERKDPRRLIALTRLRRAT
jgi:ATP-dependent helicase/nuclease subunit B